LLNAGIPGDRRIGSHLLRGGTWSGNDHRNRNDLRGAIDRQSRLQWRPCVGTKRAIVEGKLQWRASFRQSRQRFVIDTESREQAQTAADSGNRSQNRYDYQANIGEHWTSLNARAIREELRLTGLHDYHQGAAER
jgi:hypothetical protein